MILQRKEQATMRTCPCLSDWNLIINLIKLINMPNWCTSAIAFGGKAEELETLYGVIKDLEDKNEPAVPNGFGKTWLGCLVNALGGDYEKVYCRGEWTYAELSGGILHMETETAWAPCHEVYEFLCGKFPSLSYYYRSEEPGMGEYHTNDVDGVYFADRYVVQMLTPDDECMTDYFPALEDALEWIGDMGKCVIESEKDVALLDENWKKENPYSYCQLIRYEIDG